MMTTPTLSIDITTLLKGSYPPFISLFSLVNLKSFPITNPNKACINVSYPGESLSISLT